MQGCARGSPDLDCNAVNWLNPTRAARELSQESWSQSKYRVRRELCQFMENGVNWINLLVHMLRLSSCPPFVFAGRTSRAVVPFSLFPRRILCQRQHTAPIYTACQTAGTGEIGLLISPSAGGVGLFSARTVHRGL